MIKVTQTLNLTEFEKDALEFADAYKQYQQALSRMARVEQALYEQRRKLSQYDPLPLSKKYHEKMGTPGFGGETPV